MIIRCEYCKTEFKAKPSAVKRGKKYCSKECHDRSQTKRVKKNCFYCGKQIHLSPSLVTEKNFCCNGHRLAWLSEHVKTGLNVAGHSKGHKAPHLTKLNKERNPMIAIEPDVLTRGRYVGKQHRRVAQEIIGRKLKASEEVHHINGIHDDNRPENLVVMGRSEHMKLHWELAKTKGYAQEGDDAI